MPPNRNRQPFYPGNNQPDLRAPHDIERHLAGGGGAMPLDELDYLVQSENPRAPITYSPQIVSITAGGVANAVQVLQANKLRKRFIICNPATTGDVTFCYGGPLSAIAGRNGKSFQVSIGMGFRCNSGGSRGGDSIQAVYVWSDDPNAVFPIPIMAYEAILSAVHSKQRG